MSSAMLFEDFAQVPSTFADEGSLSNIQEDWLNQLQVLDLPQLFSFKDSSGLGELDDLSKDDVDLHGLEKLLDVVPPESQHPAPGPSRTQTKISKDSKDNVKKPSVSISRDDLLKFTSDDLEAYIKTLSATRPLTAAENKEIKRQRRLIKNRESAQQSRKRKKDKVGDLEVQVGGLEGINEDRKAKLDELQAENVILRAEVNQLFSVIKDSPALSSLLMNVTSWMVMYTLAKAVSVAGISQTTIPPLLQQKMFPQVPATHAVC